MQTPNLGESCALQAVENRLRFPYSNAHAHDIWRFLRPAAAAVVAPWGVLRHHARAVYDILGGARCRGALAATEERRCAAPSLAGAAKALHHGDTVY